jgi:hypothetical protein
VSSSCDGLAAAHSAPAWPETASGAGDCALSASKLQINNSVD